MKINNDVQLKELFKVSNLTSRNSSIETGGVVINGRDRSVKKAVIANWLNNHMLRGAVVEFFDKNAQVKELVDYLDAIKYSWRDTKTVVYIDSIEGMSKETISRLNDIMKMSRGRGVLVLVNNDSINNLSLLPNACIVNVNG